MSKKYAISFFLFVLVIASVLVVIKVQKPTPEAVTEDTHDQKIVPLIEKQVDLAPWTRANIDWRQFEGSHLSVLADAQAGFNALYQQVPIFEALTGIKVEFDSVEQAAMRKKREVDLSAGSGIYDVFPIGVTFLGTAYYNNWFEFLDLYLTDSNLTDQEWYDFEDLSENSISLCKKEGQLCSIPFDYSAPILFYRKDLFEKYGLQVPDTYEEVAVMKKQMQKALEADGIKDVYGFASRTRIGAGMNTWTVIPCLRAYGADVLDEQWRVVLNSPQGIEALKAYNDMSNGYGNPPDSRVLHFYDIRRLFKEGKLAAAFLASHYFNEIDTPEKSVIWDKWDAALTPQGPVARETSPWAWSLSISKASKNKKAAWLFIQWATSKETADLLHDGGAPARLSTWESEHYTSMKSEGLVATMKWILTEGTISMVQSGIVEFPEVGEVISSAFSEIFYGAPVQEKLDEAALKVEDIMSKGTTSKRKNEESID